MRWGRERRGTRSCVVGAGADAVRVGCGAPPHDLKQGHVLLLERGLVRVRVEVRLRELTANTPGQGWSGLVRAGQGWVPWSSRAWRVADRELSESRVSEACALLVLQVEHEEAAVGLERARDLDGAVVVDLVRLQAE